MADRQIDQVKARPWLGALSVCGVRRNDIPSYPPPLLVAIWLVLAKSVWQTVANRCRIVMRALAGCVIMLERFLIIFW